MQAYREKFIKQDKNKERRGNRSPRQTRANNRPMPGEYAPNLPSTANFGIGPDVIRNKFAPIKRIAAAEEEEDMKFTARQL